MSRPLRIGLGVAASVAALREVREVRDTYVPAATRGLLGAAAGLTDVLQRAAAEFRAGTAEREAELRADLLAGADLPRARARIDAWRAQRAERARVARAQSAEGADPSEGDEQGDRAGSSGREPADDDHLTPAARAARAPRAGSAAAGLGATTGGDTRVRRRGGSHRAEDPDDGPLGYSFF